MLAFGKFESILHEEIAIRNCMSDQTLDKIYEGEWGHSNYMS